MATRTDASAVPVSSRTTTRMSRVDDALLALARGEAPADLFDLLVMDDPFGGLIPVDDDELIEVPHLEVEDEDERRVTTRTLTHRAVLRWRMTLEELVSLPLDHRSGFLLSHIDGCRTVEEIIDVSHLGPADTLSVIDALIAFGAVEIMGEVQGIVG